MYDILKANALFSDMNSQYIETLLSHINFQVQNYKKDSLIASEGDICSYVGFVLKGMINVHKPSASGNTIVVNTLKRGDSFGDALVFSENHEYPSSIIAAKDSEVLLISSSNILELCKTDASFQKNLIKSLSDRIIYLNKKVKMLSHSTIRQRLSSYLLDESKRQTSLTLKCRHTRSEMADLIGSTRPSVSRELSIMTALGIIHIKKKTIHISNLSILEKAISGKN